MNLWNSGAGPAHFKSNAQFGRICDALWALFVDLDSSALAAHGTQRALGGSWNGRCSRKASSHAIWTCHPSCVLAGKRALDDAFRLSHISSSVTIAPARSVCHKYGDQVKSREERRCALRAMAC
eukprot:scaffold1642_cov252-Pinguiococcus_pyrenoidosus.AAC.33